MRKKDELSKRLANAIAISKKSGGFDSYLWPHVRDDYAEEVERQIKGNSPPSDVSKTFKGITIPATGNFSFECAWRPVRDAFQKFGLDPGNPAHWEQLLHHLAAIHFGRDAGAPRYWTTSRLCRLAVDFAKAKAANPDIKSETALCKLLVTDKSFGGRYSKPAGLRKVLRQARKESAWVIAQYTAIAPPSYRKKIEDWIIKAYTNFTGEPTHPIWDLPIDDMRWDLGLPDD
jgi:hypothetical protein